MKCKGADNISRIWMRLLFYHQKSRLKQPNVDLKTMCALYAKKDTYEKNAYSKWNCCD